MEEEEEEPLLQPQCAPSEEEYGYELEGGRGGERLGEMDTAEPPPEATDEPDIAGGDGGSDGGDGAGAGGDTDGVYGDGGAAGGDDESAGNEDGGAAVSSPPGAALENENRDEDTAEPAPAALAAPEAAVLGLGMAFEQQAEPWEAGVCGEPTLSAFPRGIPRAEGEEEEPEADSDQEELPQRPQRPERPEPPAQLPLPEPVFTRPGSPEEETWVEQPQRENSNGGVGRGGGKVLGRVAAWPPQQPPADSPPTKSAGLTALSLVGAAAAEAPLASPPSPTLTSLSSPERTPHHSPSPAADTKLARGSGGRAESVWSASGGGSLSGRAESLRTASGGSTTTSPRPEREASTLSSRVPVVEVSLRLGQLQADAEAAAGAAAAAAAAAAVAANVHRRPSSSGYDH